MNLTDKTALVYDNGFFLPLARCLAKSFGRVLYYSPYEKAFPNLNEGIIGDGFADIERCPDIWDVKKEVDVFIFPDIGNRGLQRELVSQGYPVWGSQQGMSLEIDRKYFMHVLEELGLDVAPHRVIVGVSALAAYLKDKTDIFIKVSRWRGSWETRHWRSWKQDAHRLDIWAVRFGGAKEKIPFLCFDKIDTQLEIGCDTYNVHGRWPELMLHGIEKKDEAYFSAVTRRADMPKELTQIMDAFSPVLERSHYCSQWSMEVRVAKEGNFFIDATCRGGLPSTASQISLWDNFAEIVWAGANGELIQPRPRARYSAECMVKVHGESGAWETIILPDSLKDSLMLSDCCMIDGQPWFPADDAAIEEIGWLVATGNTPTETARNMNKLADQLPDGADASVEALADIIREVETEQKQGIEFGEHPMPSPEIVLEPENA